MNTLELLGLVEKSLHKNVYSLGVLACDELPISEIRRLPTVLIVNTAPSSHSGLHWLAIYITEDRDGFFFDSFGNEPRYGGFPQIIHMFLSRNCKKLTYSVRQVQDLNATTCGEHCIFFLAKIQKYSYERVLNMYSNNLYCNDVMVCEFVKKIQPGLCRGHENTCVQYAKH